MAGNLSTVILSVALGCLFCARCSASQETPQQEVSMPDQIADEEDPCARRHHVEEGQSCAVVAAMNGISVEDLLMLNLGMKCNPFFSGINLCIDKGAQGRVFEEAVNDQQFQLMSRQEIEENVQQADTPAIQPDVVDTGFGRR
ncbi:hypothetical protein RvY_02752-3 [Ramazzottius varieornatus]|nr:hypothetical protein RvY_02752-3 [Ramazzottius varieornatus]